MRELDRINEICAATDIVLEDMGKYGATEDSIMEMSRLTQELRVMSEAFSDQIDVIAKTNSL